MCSGDSGGYVGWASHPQLGSRSIRVAMLSYLSPVGILEAVLEAVMETMRRMLQMSARARSWNGCSVTSATNGAICHSGK